MSQERILVIDPGDRTGWVRATREADGALTDIRQGVTALKDFALALDPDKTDSLDDGIAGYDTVVYETWRLRPEIARKMVGNDFQTSQLIGIIRYLCWITSTVKLVSQGPSVKATGLKVMTDQLRDRLKHSSEQHDQDALMHLSYYLFDRYA